MDSKFMLFSKVSPHAVDATMYLALRLLDGVEGTAPALDGAHHFYAIDATP